MPDKLITYFVVMGFKPSKGRRRELVADDPQEAPSAHAATRRAQRYADGGGAGLAFARTGIPALGVWNDAVVLGAFGELPEGVIEQATAPV